MEINHSPSEQRENRKGISLSAFRVLSFWSHLTSPQSTAAPILLPSIVIVAPTMTAYFTGYVFLLVVALCSLLRSSHSSAQIQPFVCHRDCIFVLFVRLLVIVCARCSDPTVCPPSCSDPVMTIDLSVNILSAGGGATNYARCGEAKRFMLLLAYSVAYV
ncbi:unnamed protein product [Citrullus colocynthis]|uniref:Uncharacterized protein n=1 Tax=Citrullus colocynthis TaxID=252529 RepID=A0ABP0XNR5_9ROSI